MAKGEWELYKTAPQFVLGFHGCEEDFGESVLAGRKHLRPSDNKHDWLGKGIYFWESNPERALQWAENAKAHPEFYNAKIEKPFVLGAVIDLGQCCNLFDSDALAELVEAHKVLAAAHEVLNKPLPQNAGKTEDRVLRYLDSAVIQTMHALRAGSTAGSYDTVRAAFSEGGDLYDGAGFKRKSHIQIAVCNPDCIKGYFRTIRKQR